MTKIKVLVDADACPVRKIIIRVAKEFNIPVITFYDESHIINDGYSENVIVETGRDSVDTAITGIVGENDIVITQDFGLAELCLKKKAKVMNQNAVVFSEYNINLYIMSRDENYKKRFSGVRTANHKKRRSKDDLLFENAFRQMCREATNASYR